jgi:hypothetical protein
MDEALRIELAARTALGFEETMLLGGIVNAGSIIAGKAFTVAIA